MPLQNPYPGSEILTKDIGQILEEFLASEWSLSESGLTVSDVKFGGGGTKMAKTRKNVAIRAYQVFSDIQDMALGGHVNGYDEMWRIDIWVRDSSTTTFRSPKLYKLLKHVESIFLENKTGLQSKGISSMGVYQSTPVENPDSEDLYHGVVGVRLRYVMNLV